MMMLLNGNIFCITGPLFGEFTGHRWIPPTMASEAELCCFLWSAPEEAVEYTIGTPVIWDAITLIMTSLSWFLNTETTLLNSFLFGRWKPNHPLYSMPWWLLMTWQYKEPGHYQPWYWPCHLGISRCQHQWTLWALGDSNGFFVHFKLIFVIDGGGISCEIALERMPLDHTCDKSTLVQVMAWCHQTTSHYLSQCWPRSMSPHGVTRAQWVNALRPGKYGLHLQMTFSN